jgi:hypothetical protein
MFIWTKFYKDCIETSFGIYTGHEKYVKAMLHTDDQMVLATSTDEPQNLAHKLKDIILKYLIRISMQWHSKERKSL